MAIHTHVRLMLLLPVSRTATHTPLCSGKSFTMSFNNLAGEVIGAAVRDLAMFVVSAILIVAVVVVIAIGLRALQGRRGSRLRDENADRQAFARPEIMRPALLLANPGMLPRRSAVDANRRDRAPDRARVPA